MRAKNCCLCCFLLAYFYFVTWVLLVHVFVRLKFVCKKKKTDSKLSWLPHLPTLLTCTPSTHLSRPLFTRIYFHLWLSAWISFFMKFFLSAKIFLFMKTFLNLFCLWEYLLFMKTFLNLFYLWESLFLWELFLNLFSLCKSFALFLFVRSLF